jgi:hypothetical protein
VSALGPGDIWARQRPWVIAAIAAVRLSCGFCLTLPIASLLASAGVSPRPEGDRALFEGGGYLLLELLRLQGAALGATFRGLLPLFGVGLLLTAVCNAALLVALNTGGRLSRSDWLWRTAARVPGIVLLGLATALAQLVLVVVAVLVSGAVPEPLASPMATTLGQASVWLVAAVLGGALGGFADVARAALVRYETGLMPGLARALSSLRHRPFRSCFGWVPYALCLLLAAGAGAQVASALDVSRPGAWRVALVFLVHQAIVLAAVALRAGWFARALRLIATDENSAI